MDLTVKGRCESGSGDFTICMITVNPDVPPAVSEIYHLEAGQDFEIHWKINCYPQYPIKALAFQIHSQQRTDGRILIDYVDCSGSAELAVKNNLYCRGARSIYGWISNLDFIRGWFSDDNLQ